MPRDRRQGAYLIIAGPVVYVGSTAGGTGRSFGARLSEHLRALETGQHPNDALSRQYARDHGHGWRMVVLAAVAPGDVALARRVEGVAIKALGRSCCNERKP